MTYPLSCRNVTVSIAGRDLVTALDLDVARGEIVCILGINGAGKTTTLETLCGLHPRGAGTIRFASRDLEDIGKKELARRIGLMPQKPENSFAERAGTLAAMGRHPHKGFFEWQDQDDLAAAERALSQVGLDGFAERASDTLSGGERQRLALAMLLVQAPEFMLLDEPLSQLDPFYQIEIGRLLQHLREAGHGIVMSVHDLNLAARLGDRVLLLYGDGRWQLGDRREIMHEAALSELYGTPIRCVNAGDERLFLAASR